MQVTATESIESDVFSKSTIFTLSQTSTTTEETPQVKTTKESARIKLSYLSDQMESVLANQQILTAASLKEVKDNETGAISLVPKADSIENEVKLLRKEVTSLSMTINLQNTLIATLMKRATGQITTCKAEDWEQKVDETHVIRLQNQQVAREKLCILLKKLKGLESRSTAFKHTMLFIEMPHASTQTSLTQSINVDLSFNKTNNDFAAYVQDLDHANLMFVHLYKEIKDIIEDAGTLGIHSSQNTTKNEFEKAWDHIALMRLKLEHEKEFIATTLQILPQLKYLETHLTQDLKKFNVERKGFEKYAETIAMSFDSQRHITDTVKRQEMAWSVRHYAHLFEQHVSLMHIIHYHCVKYYSKDLHKNANIYAMGAAVAALTAETPNPKPGEDLGKTISNGIDVLTAIPSDNTYLLLETSKEYGVKALKNEMNVERKKAWDEITDLLVLTGGNSYEFAVQLNHLADASTNGYFSFKSYYDPNTKLGTTTPGKRPYKPSEPKELSEYQHII